MKVDGEKLFINDKALLFPGDRKAVIELLGKPSRVLIRPTPCSSGISWES